MASKGLKSNKLSVTIQRRPQASYMEASMNATLNFSQQIPLAESTRVASPHARKKIDQHAQEKGRRGYSSDRHSHFNRHGGYDKVSEIEVSRKRKHGPEESGSTKIFDKNETTESKNERTEIPRKRYNSDIEQENFPPAKKRKSLEHVTDKVATWLVRHVPEGKLPTKKSDKVVLRENKQQGFRGSSYPSDKISRKHNDGKHGRNKGENTGKSLLQDELEEISRISSQNKLHSQHTCISHTSETDSAQDEGKQSRRALMKFHAPHMPARMSLGNSYTSSQPCSQASQRAKNKAKNVKQNTNKVLHHVEDNNARKSLKINSNSKRETENKEKAVTRENRKSKEDETSAASILQKKRETGREMDNNNSAINASESELSPEPSLGNVHREKQFNKNRTDKPVKQKTSLNTTSRNMPAVDENNQFKVLPGNNIDNIGRKSRKPTDEMNSDASDLKNGLAETSDSYIYVTPDKLRKPSSKTVTSDEHHVVFRSLVPCRLERSHSQREYLSPVAVEKIEILVTALEDNFVKNSSVLSKCYKNSRQYAMEIMNFVTDKVTPEENMEVQLASIQALMEEHKDEELQKELQRTKCLLEKMKTILQDKSDGERVSKMATKQHMVKSGTALMKDIHRLVHCLGK